MTTSLTYAESVLVAATPQEVYAVVSDVTRTGEWSPVCQECWWDEGDGPHVGAFFTGRNVTVDRTWETRCEVVAAKEGRAFGWSVSDGNVYWTYTMQAVDGGTELTESWEFTPKGHEFFELRFGDAAAAQIAQRQQAARDGIAATLATMKKIIEQS
jgi:ribosome-associated toxin RatA of RatAB toxin-antitoxin module